MCLVYATFTERLSSQCDAFRNLNHQNEEPKQNATVWEWNERAERDLFKNFAGETCLSLCSLIGLSNVNVVGHAGWIKTDEVKWIETITFSLSRVCVHEQANECAWRARNPVANSSKEQQFIHSHSKNNWAYYTRIRLLVDVPAKRICVNVW